MTMRTLLRGITVFEALCAAAIAFWLTDGRGWPPVAALLTGIAAPLLVHAFAVAFNFGLSRVYGGPVRRERRLGFGAALAMYLRELGQSIRLFQWRLPWGATPSLALEAAGSPEIPVVLIHGFGCNRQVWEPMARWLAQQGHAIEAIDLEPPLASIDDYVPQISDAVRRLSERTDARRVARVCHSMGGLAARAWVRDTGGALAARIVTLGSPHRGTVNAYFGAGANSRQMRPDSEWLVDLQASESRTTTHEQFTVVLSHHDNVIAPQSIQTLEGAQVVAFDGVGHLNLLFDRRVWVAVDEALSWAD